MMKTLEQVALRVAKECGSYHYNGEDCYEFSAENVATFARCLVEELGKQEPVAWVRYEIGVRPTFVPVINGQCEVSIPKLREFTPLYLHPALETEDEIERMRRLA